MQQLKHDKAKKPEDPIAAKAKLEKKAKGVKWQTVTSWVGIGVTAAMLAVLGRDCCGTFRAPATVVRTHNASCGDGIYQTKQDPGVTIDTVRTQAPPLTFWQKLFGTKKLAPDTLDVFGKIYTDSAGCADAPAAPVKAPKKAKAKVAAVVEKPVVQPIGCGPCDGSITGSENVSMTLSSRAFTKTISKISALKEALGVQRSQSLTVTYLVEVDGVGRMTLKGTKATSGGNTLDASKVVEITGFYVNGTTGNGTGICCTTPITVVLPAEY